VAWNKVIARERIACGFTEFQHAPHMPGFDGIYGLVADQQTPQMFETTHDQ